MRKAGFKNLSMDLIYGLPGQTMQQWEDTLAAVIALAPEHISCYGLKLEPGTPLYDRRDSERFPDDDAQADMYLYAVTVLAQNGYENDLTASRLHHEIYLSDPRKTAPEKQKTVIRHPIKVV